MEFYWDLTLRDGTVIRIPPDKAPMIQSKIARKDPITMRTRSIPFSDIQRFEISDKPYGQQHLIEDAARAFNEPVLNEDGSIVCKWVRKIVTQNKWEKYYSAHPGYKKLGDENGMAIVAFRLPVHEIDVNLTSYCTEEEVGRLTR